MNLKFYKEHLKIIRVCIVCFAIAMIVAAVWFIGNKLYEDELYGDVTENLTNDVLIYGADDSAPPLRFIDERDGQYKGVCVDYINLIALELGVKIVSKPYIWEDALDAVQSGESDMCDMFADEKRGSNLVFTKPLFSLRTIMVYSEGCDYNLEDIGNLSVATQKGDWANGYLEKNYPSARQVYVHDVGEGLELLMHNEVDAVIGDEPVVQYYATEKGIKDKICTLNTALYEEPVVLGVSKDKAELIKPLNHAINKVKASGQVEKIQQRWFGISVSMNQEKDYVVIVLKYLFFAAVFAACAVIFRLIENKALRKKVKIRTAELEKNRNELNITLNEVPEGIIILDSEKKIQNMNKTACTLVQMEKEQLENADFKEYCKLIGVNDSSFYMLFGNIGKQPIKIESSNKIYEFRSFIVEYNEADKEDWMITIKDITSDELRNSELLQSSKMMAIGQLAAGMAHQLRNPLGIIRTQCYIMKKNLNGNEKAENSLEYIDRSVQRASKLIDSVMNFWRMSAGKTESINVKEAIESILIMNADELKKKKIKALVHCDTEINIRCNQESLKHVLMNLIQNAIEAIEKPDGEITVNTSVSENNCYISIKDNGMGIALENLANLYNPFFTTKAPGKGTGLGLYIVYNEVKNLKGNIHVESEEGKGSAFTVTIPVAHKE